MLLAQVLLAKCANSAVSVIHIVADDLGRADLGFRNGNISKTPTLDMMAQEGVLLDSHYVFKVCAPTRASILSGRYAWGIGFYNVGGDNLGVDPGYEFLPKALRRVAKAQDDVDVATVAIGKWHAGALLKAYTPTYRGFESYFGYYHAAVSSYWYHGGECGGCSGTDLSNSTGLDGDISPANRSDVNGTYDTLLFTEEATRLIAKHDVTRPLYVYLAYQAVHAAADSKHPMNAPISIVEKYASHIVNDTYKVMSSMTSAMDTGIADIMTALDAKGMLDDTLFVVTADNGGPLEHAYNYPLRGGKHTFWEGGVRGEAFVWSQGHSLLPAEARGKTWVGIMHTADWLPTIIEGVFGYKLDQTDGQEGQGEELRPLDGKNLWPAITSLGPSPRTEVVVQVNNQYWNKTIKPSDAGQVIRVGRYKLIVGYPGDARVVKYNGKQNKSLCEPYCLFDVVADISESHDLSRDPAHKEMVDDLLKRLAAAGPPVALIVKNYAQIKSTLCDVLNRTGGYVEPADLFQPYNPHPGPGPSPKPGPGPSPGPSPIPKKCLHDLQEDCPAPFKNASECLECTRKAALKHNGDCLPRQRKAYCNDTAGCVLLHQF